MNKNLNKIAQDLYGKIETRFPNIKIGDENAGVLSKKTDIPDARFFEFEYEDDGEKLGTIAITLDEDDGIVIQVSGKLADSKHYGAFRFIRSFRQFAKNRLLKFHVQNIGKDHLDKRDYNFQAKPKEEPVMQPQQQPVMESKMYGNARMSYQDLGEARLVIKHSQPVNPEIAAGRTMHIDSIYVENSQGERFKYPFKHLSGARAMAEHLKHGGIPYDNIGKHITSLSEELAQLRKFKGYVTRNDTLAEAMNDITPRVLERIEAVKKEVEMLQRPAYYETFAESFEDREDQMIPEDIMSDWIDRLTIRTFNEELKTAFPYIFRLVDETSIPTKEINPEDLLAEDEDENYKRVIHFTRQYMAHHHIHALASEDVDAIATHLRLPMAEVIDYLYDIGVAPEDFLDEAGAGAKQAAVAIAKKESGKYDKDGKRLKEAPEDQFESFLDSIVTEAENEGHNDLFSPDVETRMQALDQLKGMMTGGKKLHAGSGGMNALSSIKGIIDSDYLNNELSALSGDDDAGSVIKTYLDKLGDGQIREPKAPKAKDIAQEIIASQVLNNTEGEAPPIGGEEVPGMPPEAGAVPPPAPMPPPELPPGSESGAPPMDMAMPPPEAGAVPPPAPPVAESSGMSRVKAKIIKAMECGAKPDDVLDFGHRTMTFAEACTACGIVPQQQDHEEPLKEIIKSISGFFNPEKRNFTIGGTRCKIKVLKDFKNGMFKGATPHHVKKVITMIDKLDPSNELGHIRHLSGMKTHPGNPQDIHLSVAEEDQLQGFDVNNFIQQLTALSKNPNQIPAAMDAIGQKAPDLIKNGLGQVLQKVSQDAPDQDIDMPGMKMNPQQMMKGIMGKMQQQESVGFRNEELSRIVSLVHHK
jgi:hypothetical protein